MGAYTSFAALVDYTQSHRRRRRRCSDNNSAWNNNPIASVSTGKWGCGMFGGTPTHKLLQQAVAARVAGVKIHFSAFNEGESTAITLENEKCHRLLEEMFHKKTTVAEAWKDLLQSTSATATSSSSSPNNLKQTFQDCMPAAGRIATVSPFYYCMLI